MIYSRPVRIILGILCFALIFWYLSRWYNNSVMSYSVGAPQVSESAEPEAAAEDAAAAPEEAETPAEPEPTPTPEPERPEVLKAAELGLPEPPEIDISQWQYVLVNGDHPLDPFDYEPAELAYLNMTGDDTEIMTGFDPNRQMVDILIAQPLIDMIQACKAAGLPVIAATQHSRQTSSASAITTALRTAKMQRATI